MQVAGLFFTSPSKAFAALKENPVFGLPMFLLLAGSAVLTAWYYGKVDIAWLQDQMLGQGKLTPEQQQMMASRMTRGVLLWSSAIAAPIVAGVVLTIGSLYFLLAGNVTNVRYSFKHWFAFECWAALPQIVAYIPSFLILALSTNTQIGASALQPLSLNELVFHLPMGAKGYSLVSALGLVQIVALWLTYTGLRVWSGRSTLFCLVFTLLPTVLIYGVWALFAFR
jgi:hypothetical protein